MQKMVCNKLFILLIGFVLVGCQDDQFWQSTNKQKQSDKLKHEEISILLTRNILDFEIAVKWCESNPNVKRVGIVNDKLSFYKGNEVNENEIFLLKSSLKKHDVSSLHCGRRGDKKHNPLSNVSFVIYARGLSISGVSQRIVYNTRWYQSNGELKGDELFEAGFISIGAPNWYLIDSK